MLLLWCRESWLTNFPVESGVQLLLLRFVKHRSATQKSPQSCVSCLFLEFLFDFKRQWPRETPPVVPTVFWNGSIIRTFNHLLSCRIVLAQFFNLVEKLVSLTFVTSVTERLSSGYTEAPSPYLWSAPCLMGVHLNQDFPERHPSVLNPRGANCPSSSLRVSIGEGSLAFQYLKPISPVEYALQGSLSHFGYPQQICWFLFYFWDRWVFVAQWVFKNIDGRHKK